MGIFFCFLFGFLKVVAEVWEKNFQVEVRFANFLS